MMVSEYII